MKWWLTRWRQKAVADKGSDLPETLWLLVRNYGTICEEVTDGIRSSGLPQKAFYLELGMSRATFDRRMRHQDWRPEELAVLVEMLQG
ncbi:MAG: hypothetical protein AAGI38_21560 [Bacteroidota bacterium]